MNPPATHKCTDRHRKTGATRALLANADVTYGGAAVIGLSGYAWHYLHERLRQIAIKRAPLTGLRMKDARGLEPRPTAKGASSCWSKISPTCRGERPSNGKM